MLLPVTALDLVLLELVCDQFLAVLLHQMESQPRSLGKSNRTTYMGRICGSTWHYHFLEFVSSTSAKVSDLYKVKLSWCKKQVLIYRFGCMGTRKVQLSVARSGRTKDHAQEDCVTKMHHFILFPEARIFLDR